MRLQKTTLVADWRKYIPVGLCVLIRLPEGDLCHFVWSAKAARLALRLLNDLLGKSVLLGEAVGDLIGLNTE